MTAEELELRLNRLGGLPAVDAEELRRACQYVDSDPGASLTKSRIILEKLVLLLFRAETGRAPRRPELGEVLNDNQFTRKIDRRIVSRMNSIRDMANLGAHGEPVLAEDASRVLEDLCAILEWHRQQPAGSGLAAAAPARRAARIHVALRASWWRRLRVPAALVGIVAFSPLVSLVGGIGPPWPDAPGVAAFCALANAGGVLFAFGQASTRAPGAGPWHGTHRWLGVFVASLVLFIVLKAFFCYNAPSFANQVAGGFVLREDARASLQDDPNATVESLLEEGLYHPTAVWEPWSVYVVQVGLLVCWTTLFASLAVPLAGALFWRKDPGGPDEALPRQT
jgi:hypothetical protein